MNDKTHTLMQRLVGDDRIGLEFDYMGASEYEFGSAHAALGVMANDFGIPHEVRETGIILCQSDFPMGARTEMTEDMAVLMDGRPLVFRYVPGVSCPEGIDRLLSLTGTGSVMNKGGFMRRDTLAWLVLDPAIGVLYHPSQEATVIRFLDAMRASRETKNPDRRARLTEALGKACHDTFCGTDRKSASALRMGILTG